MKAVLLFSTICFLVLNGEICIADSPISEAQAIIIAKDAVSPYCSNSEQCIVTAAIGGNLWLVTLQVASKASAGSQILEAGNFKTVGVDERGMVVSIAHGK